MRFTVSLTYIHMQSMKFRLIEGPNKWPDLFEACNHGKQSPVNIETANVRYSSSLTAFELQGYDSIPPHSAWSIENNGKTGTMNTLCEKKWKYFILLMLKLTSFCLVKSYLDCTERNEKLSLPVKSLPTCSSL